MDGRFTSSKRPGVEGGLLDQGKEPANRGNNALIPNRPKRYFLPALVVCVVVRLELFNRVNYQQQCAAPGIEVSQQGLPL